MKSKIIPEAMIQSPYVAYNHPCSVVTISDRSERPIPQINSEGYTFLLPIFMPKGVTDEIVVLEGNDTLNKFRKLFGEPNTASYGKWGTIAEQIIKGRFNLATLNMRPPEATNANFYVAFCLKKAMDEKGTSAKTKTLYVLQDSSASEYTFSFVKEELQPTGEELEPTQTITEIPVEMFEIGFKPYYIEKCKNTTEYAKYLSEEALINKVGTSSNTIDDTELNVPLFGLAYRGRGDYGNAFKATFKSEPTKMMDVYPYFNCTVSDGAEVDFKFTFTMFDIAKNSVNYGFGDRALLACRTMFSQNNAVQVHNSYLASRKIQNTLEKTVAAAGEKTKAYLLAKIKEKFPAFNETSSTSNWEEFVDIINAVPAMFTRNKTTLAGKSVETPLSYVNPFDKLVDMEKYPWSYVPCNDTISYTGGEMGPLGDAINDEGFDINQELTEKVPNPLTGIPEDKKYKFWERALLNFFKGKTDDALFDPTIVRDAIIYGEDYPLTVQEAVEEFTRYREGDVNFEEGRCDMCYIRTPLDSVATIQDVLDWQREFLNPTKNLNMHPWVGSWRFTDPSTGSQEQYNGFFDYLGTDSTLFRYLSSCTPDSFAAGDFSIITKGALNSMKLVPRTHAEREELANRDIIYYKRRPGGLYALGNDTGYNIGMLSVLKTVGSNIQFNRILNLALMELLKNQIINPTKDRLAILQRDIEEAIAVPAKHFNSAVSVKLGISSHEKEVDRKVVLCEITVIGNEYSRSNRLHMIAQSPNSEN